MGELLGSAAGGAVSSVIEAVRTVFEGDPETRRQVGFSVAMIALSAKMAKADGVVTEDEVSAFQELFEIPPEEAGNVSRLYNLAKQDVAGFEAYARKISRLFSEESGIREDVMDGLYHIAKADGMIHEREAAFLEEVARIFGITGPQLSRINLRHVASGEGDPYVVLGADPGWPDTKLKSHYRSMVRQYHPDQMIARGVPPEFIAIANSRLAAINHAWEAVCAERGI